MYFYYETPDNSIFESTIERRELPATFIPGVHNLRDALKIKPNKALPIDYIILDDDFNVLESAGNVGVKRKDNLVELRIDRSRKTYDKDTGLFENINMYGFENKKKRNRTQIDVIKKRCQNNNIDLSDRQLQLIASIFEEPAGEVFVKDITSNPDKSLITLTAERKESPWAPIIMRCLDEYASLVHKCDMTGKDWRIASKMLDAQMNLEEKIDEMELWFHPVSKNIEVTLNSERILETKSITDDSKEALDSLAAQIIDSKISPADYHDLIESMSYFDSCKELLESIEEKSANKKKELLKGLPSLPIQKAEENTISNKKKELQGDER